MNLSEFYERVREWLKPTPDIEMPKLDAEDRTSMAKLARLLDEDEPPLDEDGPPRGRPN